LRRVFSRGTRISLKADLNRAGAPEEKIQEATDNCTVQCIHWGE